MADPSWRQTLSPELAAALRGWRLRRGLTQRSLAQQARTSRTHVTNLEAGRRAPSVALAEDLAEVLDLSEVERERLLSEAVWAGRSNPWRRSSPWRGRY